MKRPNVFLRLSLATINCWAICLLFSVQFVFVDMKHCNAACHIPYIYLAHIALPLPTIYSLITTILTSTNAKPIELSRRGCSLTSLETSQRNATQILCERVWGFNKIPDDFEIAPGHIFSSQKEGMSGQKRTSGRPTVRRTHFIPTWSTVIKK